MYYDSMVFEKVMVSFKFLCKIYLICFLIAFASLCLVFAGYEWFRYFGVISVSIGVLTFLLMKILQTIGMLKDDLTE